MSLVKTTLKSTKKLCMKQFKPLVLLICVVPIFALTAKAGDDNGNDKDNGNHYACGNNHKDGNRVPIDGCISLLLVAGAAFGVKKAWNKNKKDVLQA
jgi:hypothetical protein